MAKASDIQLDMVQVKFAKEILERLGNIVNVWEKSIDGFPPEIREAQTTMVVLRGPDIEAMRIVVHVVTLLLEANKKPQL